METLKKIRKYTSFANIQLFSLVGFIIGFFTFTISEGVAGFSVLSSFFWSFLLFGISTVFLLSVAAFEEEEGEKKGRDILKSMNELLENNAIFQGDELIDIRETNSIKDNKIYFSLLTSDDSERILTYTYDLKTENLTWESKFYPLRRFFNKELEEFSLQASILIKKHYKDNAPMQVYKTNEDHDYSDEITEKADKLLSFSKKLYFDKEYFNFEEEHLLKESIPSQLNKIKKIYLSFSDKGKEKYKSEVQSSLIELENSLELLSDLAEDKKAEELFKSRELVRERITKRLS